MFESFMTFLETNQVASGGLLVVTASTLGYAMRRVPSVIGRGIYRRLVLSVEVLDSDESYQWLSRWLAAHEYVRIGRRMSVMTRPHSSYGVPARSVGADLETKHESARQIRYVPSPGWHLIKVHGAWFAFVRQRGEPQMSAHGMTRVESFEIFTLARNRDKADRILREARDLVHPPDEDTVSIYSGSYSWKYLSDSPARPIETVILPRGIEREVLADAEKFLERRAWYAERSIPYRRGYLLHGPPGNGKTSLILAIASHLKMNLGIVSLTNPELNDEYLLMLLSQCAQHDIIAVIEDVDEAFDENKKSKTDGQRLTYSGLTNAIDGVASPHGQLLFMTTNHRDQVGEALCRPGRVDVDVEVGNATPDQVWRMSNILLGGEVDDHQHQCIRAVADKVKVTKDMSMADVQQRLFALTGQRGKSFALEEAAPELEKSAI